MPVAAVTRLRLRALRFVPLLAWSAVRSLRQARRSDGCLAADVRTQGARVFWTCTLWRDPKAMHEFMIGGAHRPAMRRLPFWCDEAAVVNWEQDSVALPNWSDAEARLRDEGRVSRVRQPSAAHARGETMPTG
jgi:hypothetical protein